MPGDSEFRRRLLFVDSDAVYLNECANALREEQYDVITASNGFEALQVLRGAPPDIVISELNLPQMSGFELLAVLRKRFPLISVIAISGDYTSASVPIETICDAFIPKSENIIFELMEKVGQLIAESPLRGSRPRAETAPVWIPQTTTGYIILTCTECLRSFSACEPKSLAGKELCVFCGSEVNFHMSAIEHSAAPPSESPTLTSRKLRAKSREIIARIRDARGKRP